VGVAMISCKLMGGLGNYMFQIGAAYTFSNKKEIDFVVDESDIMQVHGHYTKYLTNIFRKVKFGNPKIEFIYNEPSFSYNPIPDIDNVKLTGYFQSEKYLDRNLILKLFDVSDLIPVDLKYLSDIINSDSVSIHVRRGDYVLLQNYHPPLSIEYYFNAIKYIGNKKKYFIFSDDIEWCKRHFLNINATYISGLSDWEEMYLMSLCKYNVIANSTFSWWGAWMNKNNNIVIAPNVWFGEAKILQDIKFADTSDLIPNKWIVM
jgi:hypothetical protein